MKNLTESAVRRTKDSWAILVAQHKGGYGMGSLLPILIRVVFFAALVLLTIAVRAAIVIIRKVLWPFLKATVRFIGREFLMLCMRALGFH